VGVIFQLTGSGCYSPRLHEHETPGRCYARHCQRTEKKIDLSSESDIAPKVSWVEFYHISIDDVAKYDKKEVERQNVLHEMVLTEESYVRNLTVLQTLYRDELARANPPLIPPTRLPNFLRDVFGKLDAVKKANEEYLLPQIKYRQKEQGPWIVGFSDIFRDWIRKARIAYIDYASSYPKAIFMVKQEMERNMLFKTFLTKCLQDERAARLDYNHYMKVPIGRLQSLVLLLETALGKSINDNEEKKTLQSAIEEIRKVTFECDARVGDGLRKVELSSLQARFAFKGNLPRVDLNLDHLGRELIHQGELVRAGNRFTLIESHCFLFDHFFVLSKQDNIKSADGVVKADQYDITKMVC
jgi:RhoGEF domain